MAKTEQVKRTEGADRSASSMSKRKPSGAQKDAIVTVRMTEEKKASAARVFEKLGIKPSAAINMFYDYLVEHEALPFEVKGAPELSAQQWEDAAKFVDSIPFAAGKEGKAKR